jgi:uncharacterized protein YbjT (DUF2867 family)
MRILVIGGTLFIGQAIVETLVARGARSGFIRRMR